MTATKFNNIIFYQYNKLNSLIINELDRSPIMVTFSNAIFDGLTIFRTFSSFMIFKFIIHLTF